MTGDWRLSDSRLCRTGRRRYTPGVPVVARARLAAEGSANRD